MNIKEEIITSRKNPTVMLAASLLEKKYRDREGLFRTDGIKLAREAFQNGACVKLVLLRRSSLDTLDDFIKNSPSFDAVVLEDAVFDKISEEKSPEGVICIVKHLDNFKKIATIDNRDSFFSEIAEDRTLILESLRDPGNLGTVIRSAKAFGVGNIIISSDCADVYNPKTLRASMGGVFGVCIYSFPSLLPIVREIQKRGGRVFAAALDRNAVGLDTLEIKKGDVFAVGNEGHGLSDELIASCDRSVFIPISEGSESLNASAAAAIILWEQMRQLASK